MENVRTSRKMKKTRRRKKRHIIMKRILITLVVLGISAGVTYFLMVNVFKVKTTEYVGNTWNDNEPLDNYIFSGKYDRNTIIFALKDKYGKKKTIPYVETYSVKIHWPSKVVITIYEKKIMGYINDNGRKMYFDKDGVVVDISDKKLSLVPELKGVKPNGIVLHQSMKMPSDVILPAVVEIKQQLDKYHMEVDSIIFDEDYNITLSKGNVKIKLGKAKYLTEKVYEYSRISTELGGRNGTLDLEACDGTKKSYPFTPSE